MHSTHPRLRKNNFDLLRLLFAGVVCLVHSFELSGFEALHWTTRFFSSAVAVKSFFVVSGFLIFMSYERSTSLASYISKRIRRIYPAYFTIVILCAIGLVMVSSRSVNQYFSADWLKYVAANLSFLNFLSPALPGVFDTNKMAAVNGALWTLKIEAMFYMSVPIFAYFFRKFSTFPVIVITYVASTAYAVFMTALSERTGSGVYAELARQLPGQLSYFMAGALLFYFLDFFERHVKPIFGAAVVLLAVNAMHPLPLLEPLALSIVVIFFGLFLYAGNFGKYGDFSYGFYILHFPVIQLMLLADWTAKSPWSFLATTILLTGLGAIAMWHLVEKKFLFRSSHYRASTSPTLENSSELPITAGEKI
ncbi:MAG: hypothetical protein RIR09_184 [Pseudomonadota bacterium]|jgi:peptidoglycan/LPS O-acetylase OafA/YrhL